MDGESWPGITIERYPSETEDNKAICVYHKIGNPDEVCWFFAISVGEGSSEEDFRNFMKTTFKNKFIDTLLGCGCSFLCLSGPENHYSIFLQVFSDLTDKRFQGWGEYELHHPPAQLLTKRITLPPGYRHGGLGEAHVQFLGRQWIKDLDVTPSSLDHKEQFRSLVRDNILKRPSVAIFNDQGKDPVAWMTTYQDGYGGQLHVDDAHRGRGLARLCVRELFKKTHSLTGSGYPVSIGMENEASRGLFTSEGWSKTCVTRKHYLHLGNSWSP